LAFIGKHVDIGCPVIADELNKVVRLQKRLLDLHVVEAIFFRECAFNELQYDP
jgi:hypothetical protein